jgi:rod shape-determining protein MreD
MRIVPYLLYLLLIAGHATILRDLTSIYGVTVNLTALMVLLVAVYKSELTSLWFGLAAGLVMAAGIPSQLGVQALIMTALAVGAFHARERLNLDSFYAKLLLVIGGVVLHNIALLVLQPGPGFWFLLLTVALPGALYSSLLGWVFFLLKEKRFNWQSIKAIF